MEWAASSPLKQPQPAYILNIHQITINKIWSTMIINTYDSFIHISTLFILLAQSFRIPMSIFSFLKAIDSFSWTSLFWYYLFVQLVDITFTVHSDAYTTFPRLTLRMQCEGGVNRFRQQSTIICITRHQMATVSVANTVLYAILGHLSAKVGHLIFYFYGLLKDQDLKRSILWRLTRKQPLMALYSCFKVAMVKTW